MDTASNFLANALDSAAASVVAATSALEARLYLPVEDLVIDELISQTERLRGCGPLATAMPSNVRQAAVALAHALQAANQVLKAKVLAAERRGASDEVKLSAALPLIAHELQDLALRLFDLCPLSHGDPDLAFRVAAVGVVVMESGSLANRYWYFPTLASYHKLHNYALCEVVRRLDRISSLDEGHQRSLAVLRAIFRPGVILTALRRLLVGQEPPGVRRTESAYIADALYILLHPSSIFADEQAAIERDMQLQAGIVASMDESIRRGIGLSEANSPDRDAYIQACTAIGVLNSPSLLAASRERAAGNPAGIVDMLKTCFDLILERLPPEMDKHVHYVHRLAMHSWGQVVATAYYARSGRPPLLTEALGCIERAGAAAAFMLQQPEGTDTAAESLNLKSALHGFAMLTSRIPAIYHLDPDVDTSNVVEALGSTDAALHGLFLSLLMTLESITRVAAQMRACWHLRHTAEEIAEHVLDRCDATTGFILQYALLCWPAGQPSPDGMVSQVTVTAAAGMVESFAKFAMAAAGRGPGMLQSGDLGFQESEYHWYYLDKLAEVSAYVTLQMGRVFDAETAMGTRIMKRWRGMALAASSAVVALAGSRRQDRSWGLHYKLLPLSFCSWPGVCHLLLEAPVGRSAVGQALMAALELGEGGWRCAEVMRAFRFLEMFTGGSADALDLARSGILTQLASWAEEQCGKAPLDGGCLDVLRLLRSLVEGAVHRSDLAETRAAYEAIREGPTAAAIRSADYWRCLRLEVIEPLAGTLEAVARKDAPQLAVDIAEALATRTCAYVGCTTVVGASEAAAPRGKRCSGCRLVRYCGAACQAADWPAHKAACRELRRRAAGST